MGSASARLNPGGGSRCPYCHDALSEGMPSTTCGGCQAPHHADCFQELGKCASCGQSALREFRPYRAPPEEELPLGQVTTRIALAVLLPFLVLVVLSELFPGVGLLVWGVVGLVFAAFVRRAKRGFR